MSERPKKLHKDEVDHTKTAAYAAANLLNMHWDAAPRELPEGAVATPLVKAGQTTESKVAPTVSSVLESLSAEKRERALAYQAAMAEKFGRPTEDFGFVEVKGKDDGQSYVVVMLTAGNGIHKGSYNSVMANDEDFMLDIDGQKIDTRRAMTYPVYEAFINGQKEAGANPLPDSKQLAGQNGEPHTGTWLTGEAPREFYPDYGCVREGRPYRAWSPRAYDSARWRVRPAAVV